MGRRQQRAQRMRDEARGVDTRTGEIPEFACPPRLLAPAVVEEWLTTAELEALSEADAMIRASVRWRCARDEYALSLDDSTHHLRARVAQLCGPVSRPVWRDELGAPWHVRRQ
ncbi:hypothetical protein BIV24_17105 [Streptomyces colonosanans]|uniref:Uncharacterized protein n=1 Tax=Streptomyces colonosanans TaxID=1428652 RepID=A0A1S2PBD0_9ACTN|nr:hypothetical protein BIV24_17105 [Streptomyces colonosanans]